MEQEAHDNPGRYRFKVWLLALGSYAAAVANAVVLITLPVAVGLGMWRLSGTIQTGLSTGLVIFALLFSFLLKVYYVKLSPPNARWLSRKEAPELFAQIKDLRKQLGCGPIHHVGVSLDQNAFVAAVPRFGLWGWPRHYLVIGIPLLVGMPYEEARALLAHELSHLSRRHDRIGAFVWLNHEIWGRLVAALGAQPGPLRKQLRRLAEYLTDALGSRAIVVIREHELEADRLAARVTSAPTAACTLLRTGAVMRLLDRDFWYQVNLLPYQLARPPQDILERAQAAIQEGTADGRLRQHLDAMLEIRRGIFDTHPSLAERVHALGQDGLEPDWSLPCDAGQRLLGPVWQRLLADCELAWQQGIHGNWLTQHAEAPALTETLTRLSPTWEAGTATEADGWQLIKTCIRLHGPLVALPMLDYFIEAHPKHDRALLERARIRLWQDDDRGVEDFTQAVFLNPDNRTEAYPEIAGYHQRHGRDEEMRGYFSRLDEVNQAMERAGQERATVTRGDKLRACQLEEDEMRSLLNQLATVQEIVCAYLACKEVRFLPTRRHFVVAVERLPDRSPGAAKFSDHDFANALAGALRLPGSFHVFVKAKDSAWLFDRILKVPASLIYDERA